jgi:hypothetical protein
MNGFKFFRGFTTDVIIGRRGETLMEPGYIYAPYVPIFLTPELVDEPEDMMERYIWEVNRSFYGEITINNNNE